MTQDDQQRQRPEARRQKRAPLNLDVVVLQDGYTIPGSVRDLSSGGVQVALNALSAAALRNTPIDVEIRQIGRLPARILWRAPHGFGAEFRISESLQALVHTRINTLIHGARHPNLQGALPENTPHGAAPWRQTAPRSPPQPTPQDSFTDLREAPRYKVALSALLVQDGLDAPCRVIDMSRDGAKLRIDGIFAGAIRDRPVVLDIPAFGRLAAAFVWRGRLESGVAFKIPARQAEILGQRLTKEFGTGSVIRPPMPADPLSSGG